MIKINLYAPKTCSLPIVFHIELEENKSNNSTVYSFINIPRSKINIRHSQFNRWYSNLLKLMTFFMEYDYY